MKLLDEKTNDGGFTAEEQAELDSGQDEQVETPEQVEQPADDKSETPVEQKATEQKTQQQGAKPPPGFVPKSALDETRLEARELRDKITRMETLWQQLQQERARQPQQQQQQQSEIPDYDKDPIGHLNAKAALLEREVLSLRNQHQQLNQREQQQAQANEMLNRYASSVRDFAKDTKDYSEAYEFLAKSRDEELKALGISDAAERTNRLQYEEGLLAGRALHSGQNPAQLFYQAAKLRGYKSAAERAAQERPAIERIAAGQRAASSLGSTKGNGADEGGMSLEALAALDGKEFDEQWAKMQKRGLLG